MSLKSLPLDVARLGPALCIAVAVKADTLTGEVKKDTEGVTQYVVTVAFTPQDRKAALVEVTVSGEPQGLIVGTHVALRGLEAFFWEIGGRAGLAYRADAVVPTLPSLPAQPAPAATAVKGAVK